MLRTLVGAGRGLHGRLVRDPAAIEEALSVGAALGVAARASLRDAAAGPEDIALHEARIAVKKWRYAIECLREVVPGFPAPGVRALRRMQRALGNVHDVTLLRDLIVELAPELGDREARALAPLIEQLEGERLRAVAVFQRQAGAMAGSGDPCDDAPEGGKGPGETPASPAPANRDAGAHGEAIRAAESPGAVAPDPGPDPPDPRARRWERMAHWLEQTGRGD
jgi:hypothetical protein